MLEDITFAIPTYNRNEYLSKLLNSIPEGQGAKIAISDNGNFVQEKTYQKHSENVTIVSCEKVIEMYENWNKVISIVDTKWFFIPSDDDLYYADKLEVVRKVVNTYPQADIIIFGHNVIDENDNVLSTWVPKMKNVYNAPDGFDLFKYGVSARFPSILFKTDLVREMGGIDSSYVFTAGDSLLIQKCLINGTSVFVDEVIGAYRTWSNNFTGQLMATKEWLDKIDKWQNELSLELIEKGIYRVSNKKIKDEVFAQNLIGGMNIIGSSKNSFFKKIKFLLENRYPWKAKFLTHLRIVKSVFNP